VTGPRSVTILGATGSVGRSTLDLIERDPDRYDVLALTAHRDVEGLAEAARRVGARRAVIADPALLETLRTALAGTGCEAAAGEGAILEAAGAGADWTMAAIVGTAGLSPTMAAIRGGRTVALANKEALVSAGHLMIEAAKASGAELLPVDSEHNAIFQCFDRARPDGVRRIILTASGGPFREKSLDEMRSATPCERLDLVRTSTLSFEAPDLDRFPALGLARQALREGGARPAVLSAANEVAVGAFLEGGIGFLDIASIAAETLQCYAPAAPASVEEVLEVDREARSAAEAIVKRVRR
jgi:1-deoxy-D-xylulose 5-phosphate reductoisomerase